MFRHPMTFRGLGQPTLSKGRRVGFESGPGYGWPATGGIRRSRRSSYVNQHSSGTRNIRAGAARSSGCRYRGALSVATIRLQVTTTNAYVTAWTTTSGVRLRNFANSRSISRPHRTMITSAKMNRAIAKFHASMPRTGMRRTTSQKRIVFHRRPWSLGVRGCSVTGPSVDCSNYASPAPASSASIRPTFVIFKSHRPPA